VKEQQIMAATREQILASLIKAYNMEVETVLNYLANSLHLEGVRADFIKQALAADVQGELMHAQQLGNRIKQLGGVVPGSMQLQMTQTSLQPAADTTDLLGAIRGVLEAEEAAINHYRSLIKLTDGEDYVTQDLAITILSDEEGHRQHFQSFLKEFTKK
jgi:bacterioferritin